MSRIVMRTEKKSTSATAQSADHPVRRKDRTKTLTQLRARMKQDSLAYTQEKQVGINPGQEHYLPHGVGNIRRGHQENESSVGKRVAIIQRMRNNVIQRCEIEDPINKWQPRALHKEVRDEQSLPARGDPNSSADLIRDGRVKQRRYYDKDGRAEMDIDYEHTDDGTHKFPHTHLWDWSKNPPRQDSRR